jgi:hypothetical protein
MSSSGVMLSEMVNLMFSDKSMQISGLAFILA